MVTLPQKIAGFEKWQKRDLRRLIISVEGLEKEGKTHFGLTAPGPIALFDLDIGLEGVVDKFADEKEIHVASFSYKDATSRAEWTMAWEKMKAAYYAALGSKNIKTLLWDTATEGWDLIRMGRLGSLSLHKDHSYKWGPLNTEFRDMIRKVYDTDKNLILLHKMKSQYMNDSWTGGYERSGFKDVGFLSQINARCWKRKSEGFGMTVIDCRWNPELDGMELMEPMNNFPALASLVFPNTSMEEWE